MQANDSTRGTLSEGALAPRLGDLQRRRASGWLRISGMQLRGGIPSVVRLGLRLHEGRVVGVEAADDPLRPLPPGADLTERATHGLARVLACRDAVQSWEPATEDASGDPASPWLAALAVRAVERLADASAVEAALGDLERGMVVASTDDVAVAALAQAQRALLTCVRGETKAADLVRSIGDTAPRNLLALMCTGALRWAATAEDEAETTTTAAAPEKAPPPVPPRAPAHPSETAARERPGTGQSKAFTAPKSADPTPARPAKPAAPAAPPRPTSAAMRHEIESAHAALRGSTHFQVLGIGVGASADEVRQAFSKLARRYHPDSQRDPELHDLRQKLTDIFVAVSDAYGVLKDQGLRDRYERSMGLQPARPSTGTAHVPASAPVSASSSSDPVEARLIGAEEALAAQQPWEAIRLLEEAIPAASGEVKVRAQILLGKSYAARERPREAEKILLDVLQTDPRSVSACLLLGRMYRDRGMAKRARGMFERVLEVDPRNVEARRELGVPAESAPETPPRGSILSRLRDRH